MSIGYESWAVDMANVGPIYPMQGWEFPMAVVGIIFWLAWHRIQFVREGQHLDQAKARAIDHERLQELEKAVERY